MKLNTVTQNGRRFVLVPLADYKRLKASEGLPALPPADRNGNRDALDFARAALARKIIQQRRGKGLTQQQLADLAGVRQETISRLESAKHLPSRRVLDKIDKALRMKQRRAG